MQPKYIFMLFLPFLFLFRVTTSKAQDEVENDLEFNYFPGSLKGPQHWGDLEPEWALCKTGKWQSPVDLCAGKMDTLPNSQALKIYYKPSHALIKNRGHDIQIVWSGDAGSIKINGLDYALKSAHWHSPSEHSVNGKRFDSEMHIVHEYKDRNGTAHIAVIGLLFKIGAPDPFLRKLTGNITSLVDEVGKQADLGVLDPNEIGTGCKNYYRYRGSLTTPPCSEGVIWTVKKKIRMLSTDQLLLLRAAVDDDAKNNARPLQPLNGRKVGLFTQLVGCTH